MADDISIWYDVGGIIGKVHGVPCFVKVRGILKSLSVKKIINHGLAEVF